MRKCGCIVRVSTDRQAMNDEGSLKTQQQRIAGFLELKHTATGEEWTSVRQYVLKGVSGKDSMRSPEFRQLFADVEAGRIDTVVCTALDRVSRSVRDFLNFFEFLNDHGVEFVCIKQNYDTTTPQGKLFIHIMMALAEFEREQTSLRTKDAYLARAERGLFNGGQLFGYDLNPERKGYLFVNEEEAAGVRFAFRTYLETGSLALTTERLNDAGYRTKSYTSRRGVEHPAKKFHKTTVQGMLQNYAYVGKKELKKKEHQYSPDKLLTDAVWKGIVDEEVFEEVQNLMALNHRTRGNNCATPAYTFLLNGGKLRCGVCGGRMEGRSGTGRKQTYFYYRCMEPCCRMKVRAADLEGKLLARINRLAKNEGLVTRLVNRSNRALGEDVKPLAGERRTLEQHKGRLAAEVENILTTMMSMEDERAKRLLQGKLSSLAERMEALENRLAELNLLLDDFNDEAADAGEIQKCLKEFVELLDFLPPFKRKELIQGLLHSVQIDPKDIDLKLYAIPNKPVIMRGSGGVVRRVTELAPRVGFEPTT